MMTKYQTPGTLRKSGKNFQILLKNTQSLGQGTTFSFLLAAKPWRSKFRKSVPTIRASIGQRFIATSTEQSLRSSKKRSFPSTPWLIAKLTCDGRLFHYHF